MDEKGFKLRTKRLGLSAVQLVARMPRNPIADVMARQLVRSATSVGANYRAACRGQSRLDVLAKLAIVEGEADEVIYWLELLTEAGYLSVARTERLSHEANEILAMTVASIKTLRGSSIQNPKSKIQNQSV
jgi:four helix bundle protein